MQASWRDLDIIERFKEGQAYGLMIRLYAYTLPQKKIHYWEKLMINS